MDAARLCCLKTERAAIMFATSATELKQATLKGNREKIRDTKISAHSHTVHARHEMINNEEAVIKLPRTKSLEKFIDEVHTNLISLHLHRPPLLYAVDAIKTREKALEKTEREKSLKKNGKRLILEFGVGAGGTMRRLIEQFPCCSDNQNVLLYGFDSFEGLPEVLFFCSFRSYANNHSRRDRAD